ncbi:Alpha/Beta hydrolase protein [Cercophora newfieldiana]|uniref:Alpha/Beta hydrolase protein n=1 Tax=Cercophora newfieldiana TaxID=92897 RepID=A0AA39YH95_9PEZI|nr:Alpha/Beta hydrolase protein [Cercophora newfieldiana]
MADPVDNTNPHSDEVKPYRIHIPTRHLELTKRKLELTRLPHESPAGLWEPKAEVETLIDFWQEKYSWRDQESVLNTSFPQFRTSISLPESHGTDTSSLRIHFIHVRSNRPDALPLLVIPPFPFTNLSFGHLIAPLADPPAGDDDAPAAQAFHVVLPCLPGLGFSDALPPSVRSPIAASAGLFDALMERLEYKRYVATATAPGHMSPARIDYRLVRRLATHHTTSCVGTHLISPPLATPDVRTAPWEWTKWTVARFFRAGVLGYDEGDFAALERPRWVPAGASVEDSASASAGSGMGAGLNGFGTLREPNAMAYALCDSPVGMLVFVLKALWLLGRREGFSEDRIVTSTMLAWLPGFEHALRFWAGAAKQADEAGTGTVMPKVAVTVFMGESASRADDAYACPAWANAEFDVVGVQRLTGKNETKGLMAFERPEAIIEGARSLARGLLAQDAGAFLAKEKGVAVVPLEKVVVVPDAAPGLLTPRQGRGIAGAGVLATPAVTPGDEKDEDATPKAAKGKEREVVDSELPQPAPIPVRDPLLDGESPDTLVEGSKTPPLEKEAGQKPST